MAWEQFATGLESQSASGDATVQWPTSSATGHLGVLVWTGRTTGSPTPSVDQGWTHIRTTSNTSASPETTVSVWYKVYTTSETNPTVTCTNSGYDTFMMTFLATTDYHWEYVGIASAANTGTDATMETAAYSTTNYGELVIMAGGQGDNNSPTATSYGDLTTPNGFDYNNSNAGDDTDCFIMYGRKMAAGSVGSMLSTASSDPWVTHTFSFMEFSSGTSYPAAGSVAATSAVSNTITKHAAASGTVAASSTASGTATKVAAVSGTVAGISAVSGGAGLSYASYLTGLDPGEYYYVRAYATSADGTAYGSVEEFAATGSAAAAGVVDAESESYGSVAYVAHPVSGTVAAASTASGTVTKISSVSGSVAAASTASASVSRTALAAGSVSASSTASGAVTATRVAAGSVAASSTVSGAAAHKSEAAGTVAGASAVNGAVTKVSTVAGSVASTSTASGIVYVSYAAAGSSAGVSSVSCDATRVAATLAAAGTVAGVSAANCTVTKASAVSGSVAVSSTTSGAVTKHSITSGTVAGVSAVSCAVTFATHVSGTCAAVSAANCAATVIEPGTYAASGTVDGVSGVSASAIMVSPTVGTVAGTSAASGVAVKIALAAGTVAATSAVSCDATHVSEVSGTVSATSAASGSATKLSITSGTAAASSTASCSVTKGTSASGTAAAESGVSGAATASSSSGYNSYLINLDADEHYYVRAYATNDTGTSYGSVEEFDTPTSYAVTGTVACTSGASGTIAMWHWLYTDWYQYCNAVSGVSAHAEGGGFGSSLIGLDPGEHYYVRAYATSDDGTGYGSVEEFDTLDLTDVEGTVSAVSGVSGAAGTTHTWTSKGMMGMLLFNHDEFTSWEVTGSADSVCDVTGTITAFRTLLDQEYINCVSGVSLDAASNATIGQVDAVSGVSGEVGRVVVPSGTVNCVSSTSCIATTVTETTPTYLPDIYLIAILVLDEWIFGGTIDEWSMSLVEEDFDTQLIEEVWETLLVE